MLKKLFKSTSLLLFFILMLGSIASAAGNETVKSGESTVTRNGMEYVYYAEAYTYNETGIYAKATLKTKNGNYVSPNTMRVNVSLYDANNNLIRKTATAENSVRATALSASTNSGNRGTFYAVGEVQIYVGQKWETFTTLKTGTIKY